MHAQPIALQVMNLIRRVGDWHSCVVCMKISFPYPVRMLMHRVASVTILIAALDAVAAKLHAQVAFLMESCLSISVMTKRPIHSASLATAFFGKAS
jgi:hypothetical protein